MASSLVDTFGRAHTYLRVSLTERCNLRCQYCMPAEGVPLKPRDEILSYEELLRLSKLFVSLGVDKIRLTGGEPLVRKDVVPFIARLGAIDGLRSLAMTTNALLLSSRLEALKAGGLTHLNISLDTLRDDRFREITRRKGLDKVLAAIDDAIALGYRPKINCVVLRDFNEDELLDFVALTHDRPLDVRFIEYMPFDGNEGSIGKFLPFAEALEIIQKEVSLKRLSDGPHETSKTYQAEGYLGTVGFISSMSDDFCSGCNRLRITADGNLKVCLFGRSEISLRDAARAGADDHELTRLIQDAVLRKKAAHAGMFTLAKTPNRPMILIGG
ncbi:MAG: GTP 3',8-cyclase MoaA [Rhodothermales bacterium]